MTGRRRIAVIALALSGAPPAASGDEETLRAGLALQREGRAEEALALYEQVASSEDPYLQLARADAHASLGQAEEAETILRSLTAPDVPAPVRRRASFDLGSLQLDAGRTRLQEDPEAAIETLQASERSFRAAWSMQRDDLEAARHVEFVRRLIKQARDAAAQEQRASRQMQEQADAMRDLADRQEQAAAESQEASDRQQPADAEMQERQEALSEQAREMAEQLEQQDSDQMQQARDAMSDAREAQQQAEQALAEGRLEDAAEAQRRAAEHLRAGAKAAAQAASNMDQAPGERAEQPAEAEPAGQQEDQEPTLAEQLLDREREQRASRVRAVPGRPVRVEKDW